MARRRRPPTPPLPGWLFEFVDCDWPDEDAWRQARGESDHLCEAVSDHAGLVVDTVTRHGVGPVSFTAEPGQLVVITSSPGNALAIITGVIAGFDQPESGRVLLDGADLHELDEGRLAEEVGWLCATIVTPGGDRRDRPVPRLVVGDQPEHRIEVDRVLTTCGGLAAGGAVVVLTTLTALISSHADVRVRLP